MNNRTNLIKYRLLAHVYDAVFSRLLAGARRKAFSVLQLPSGAKVLLVGVGTGQDLPHLPADVSVTGIDLSEAMLARARRKSAGRNVTLLQMNAEALRFADGTFDAVVLSLVLSVVENPRLALCEAARVVKAGGTLLVFDKFLADGRRAGPLRTVLGSLTAAIGTDINRRFADIAAGLPVSVALDRPALLGGNYRIVALEVAPAEDHQGEPHADQEIQADVDQHPDAGR